MSCTCPTWTDPADAPNTTEIGCCAEIRSQDEFEAKPIENIMDPAVAPIGNSMVDTTPVPNFDAPPKVATQDDHDNEKGCCGLCPGEPPHTEHEVLELTWWFTYVACCGFGFSEAVGSCKAMAHCFCCKTKCEPIEFENEDGIVNCISTCCCCTVLQSMPPRHNTPKCMLCSFDLMGLNEHHHGSGKHKHDDDEDDHAHSRTSVRDHHNTIQDRHLFWDFSLWEQFVPFYAYCCGWSCHNVYISACNTAAKCGGCKCRTESVCLDFETCDCTSCLTSIWHFRSQCRVPPIAAREDNPVCACFGWRLSATQKVRAAKRAALHDEKAGHVIEKAPAHHYM
eukprot:TRINITY_DN21605_c0_g5_i1.p1 TRINITY_DN21605_c0_g5~~TRINITY_DN21605_c0_g5_i1.p1  ORF type:complete len:338 (-),score=29.20 TRINITY_DN21605_c0_g5_i1:53-1066(-)